MGFVKERLDTFFVKYKKKKNPPEKTPDGSPMKNWNGQLSMNNMNVIFQLVEKPVRSLRNNLMSIFRLFVLQEKTQKTLSTLRYRTFAIGAYFIKVGASLILTIALTRKRRKWFVGILDYPIDLSQKISTAWFGFKYKLMFIISRSLTKPTI